MKNMNTKFPFGLIAICLLTISFFQLSCTSLQQSTASIAKDDLYDIPTKVSSNDNSNSQTETLQQDEQEDASYQEYQNYQDDRYLRLKVANRNRWTSIDDYGYWNDPRYNFAYYPSYLGWNSWYSGYYGNSWYHPFGYSIGLGWGGYYPYMNSFYSVGWGWNDYGWGFGGLGYGMGWGGYGYGWNPFYAGYWNPYGPIYYNNYYGGGLIQHPIRLRDRIPVQPGRTNLAAYNNFNRNYSSNGVRPNGVSMHSRNVNSATLNKNNFGSLIRRAVNNNANYQSSNRASQNLERPTRNSNYNQFNSNPARVSSNNTSSPSSNSSSNSSGGGHFVGGGRRGGGGK